MTHSLPVLVIEDEPCLLAFFKAALLQDGMNAVGVTSGEEALQLLQSGQFAGIISDLRIGTGMNGGGVFEWVRRNRPELSKRFMFITGDAQAPDAIELRARTGALFLEKPFRLGQMLTMIKEITARDKTYA